MKRLILLILAIALFAPAAASEYRLSHAAVFVDVEQKSERFFINLTCVEGEVNYFDFGAQRSAKATTTDNKPLRSEVTQGVLRVYFDKPVRANESQAFYADFEGAEVKHIEDKVMYYKSLSFPMEVEKLSFAIRLPQDVYPEISTYGASCTNPDCNCRETGICICENCTGGASCSISGWHSATTLPPDEISIIGNRVTVGWVKSLKPNEKFEIGLLYSAGRDLRYYAAVVAILLAFFFGFFIAWRMKRASVVGYVLNEEEKLVVDFVKSRGGEALQEDIWKEESLQFSRPKVSRIIADLEQRGVLKREAYKKTFKVSLVAF